MMKEQEELKTIKEQLDDAHNKMLILDQNYYRVKKLHDSEIDEIKKLQDDKADLTNQIQALTREKNTLEINVHNLSKSSTDLNADIVKEEIRLADIKKNIETETGIQNEKRLELEQVVDRTTKKEELVLERERAVTISENILAEKHNKIKSFKETL